MNPLVSIIVPCYNVELYLRPCLDSIVNQTYANIEILVINDGSTDNTLDIIKEYEQKDKRIILFDTCNKGLSAARNLGLDHVHGELIMFIDSDDLLDIRTIEYNIPYFDENDEIDTVYFPIKFYNSDQKVAGGYFYEIKEPEILSNKQMMLKRLKGKGSVSVCAKMYRKKVFDQVKFPEGKVSEDTWVNSKVLFQSNKNMHSPQGLYLYTQRPSSIVSTWSLTKFVHLIESYRNCFDEAYLYFPDLKNDIALAEFNVYWGFKRNEEYNRHKETKDIVREFYNKSHKKNWLNFKVLNRMLFLSFLHCSSLLLGKKYFVFKTRLKQSYKKT
jgi:glycosyltransferase involved in cell wall biosynthesis